MGSQNPAGAGVLAGEAAGAKRAPPPGEEELTIRAATCADVAELAQLYAITFAGNPDYRFVFSGTPAAPAPPGALLWLFERRVRLLLRCGCPLLVACAGAGCSSERPTIVGACGLVPFANKPTMWHFILEGLLLWPLYWGYGSLARALQLDKQNVQLSAAGGRLSSGREGSGKHSMRSVQGELSMMAVRPSHQVGVGAAGQPWSKQ